MFTFLNGSLFITVAPLLAGNKILLSVGKHFLSVSLLCQSVMRVKLLCRPLNQSLLCDQPLVLHSISTICSLVIKRIFSVYAVYSGEGKCLHTFAKITNGIFVPDSSIDSLIAVLYI